MKTVFLRKPVLLCLLLHACGMTSRGDELYYGAELMGGFRSQYLYNGRKMANDIIELQASAGVALNNYCDANASIQGFQALSDSFASLGLTGELDYFLSHGFHLKPRITFNGYHKSEFRSGFELGASITQDLNQEWSWEVMGLYDTGQDAPYGSARIHYFPLLTQDIGLKFTAGTGGGYDYFESRGINEVFGRVSAPIRIGESWVIEPFVGISSQHDQRNAKNRVYFGVWASFLY